MKVNHRIDSRSLWMTSILLTTLMAGCNSDNNEPAQSTPIIISSNIADLTLDVATNSQISVTFSEAMDTATINEVNFSVATGNEAPIMATVSLDNASNTAILTPSNDFTATTLYTAKISREVKSALGIPLANEQVWSFTTAAAPDTTAPSVKATYPLNTEVNFAINRSITAEMSEFLAPNSVNTSNFTLSNGITLVTGTINYSNTTVTFLPDTDLETNTIYTATLTTGITDLAIPANALAESYVWSFTTGLDAAAGPYFVNLRSAGNMAILSKSGITNVPTSNITGNIGASPITAASMDTVFCSDITGIVYGADAAYTGSGDSSCFAGTAPDNTLVANAVLDMGTAYADAAGRTTPDFTELYAGDLSSQTLSAGLYKWGTDVLVSTDVTLNGGANDVWIFQVAGDVIMADGSSIYLTGGAQAKNVFWQVGGGTGAVIGTTAQFEGIVLAKKGITVNTGASVNGRLLAQTAVTLDQNTITQPTQ